MQTTKKLTALAFAASFLAMAVPVSATTGQGNQSATFDLFIVSEWDFKDGVGIFEPGGPGNPCPGQRLLGLRALVPPAFYYDTARIGTNLKGIPGVAEGFHVDGIDPIPLAPCPLPLVPPQEDIEIWFSGINWRLLIDGMSSELRLCTQLIQTTDGGCIANPTNVELLVANCPVGEVTFNDNSPLDGKPDFGVFDVVGEALEGAIMSDGIACGDWGHDGVSHDYSDTVTFFDVNIAAQGFDVIQNRDIVHSGTGDAYAVICWTVEYENLDTATTHTAVAHDWKLILDLGSDPATHEASLQAHFGLTGPHFLPGWYTLSPGSVLNGYTDEGNGSPCPDPTVDHNKKLGLIQLPPDL